MATSPAQIFARENSFFGKLAIALALLVVAGFGLFTLMGMTDVATTPISTHLHGVVMASWLVLLLVQNALGSGRNLALHRKLGKFGAVLAVVAVLTAWNTANTAMSLNRAPPVFNSAYFLALGYVMPIIFGLFVLFAIRMRKRTDWHRRLMLGTVIIVLEPALGRLAILGAVPALGGPETAMPILIANPWAVPMVEMILQLAIAGAIMLRDRAIRGSVHPAMWVIIAAIPVMYGTLALLANFAPFVEHTASVLGSGL